jgi:diguanylate cyclase (GGDEF)-like protein
MMKKTWQVLLVDDDRYLLRVLEEFLTQEGYAVTAVQNGQEAIGLMAENDFAVVVTDLVMQPVSGERIIEEAKSSNPLTEVILLTAYPSLDTMVEAIRARVFDYLPKPVDLDRLSRTVENAVAAHELAVDNHRMIDQLNQQHEILESRITEVARDLEQLSTIDSLTGLYNYRYFAEVIQTEVSRAVRYRRPLALAMLDLDHFKHYNDCYGHVEGNKALEMIAEKMRATVRGVDILVRYGGEEFAIILPETPKEKARINLSRVCKCVRDLGLEIDMGGEKRLITISCGLAACPDDAEDSEELVQNADLALYRAKSMGRNQIVFYSPSLSEKEGKR